MNGLKYLLFAAVLLSSVGAVSAAPAQQLNRQDNLPQQNAALYATVPQPLTLDQCGQCHPKHYRDIKQVGGKHQFDCRECHTIFHAYNPRKDNYATIMPQCTSCHPLLHGEKHSQCLTCHENPHAALQSPTMAKIKTFCADCHRKQLDQLTAQPSRHSELACNHCHHTEHGLIPSCSDCHQSHFDGQSYSDCKTCHDVHQPLAINLNQDADLRNCAACHIDIYGKWRGTKSKHGQVSCTACHSVHGMIPQCQDCHATPVSHSKAMLAKFPQCLDCHLDVHDLPTKR